MFDLEKEEMVEATEKVTPSWVNGEWEKITDEHATREETSGRTSARAAVADPEAVVGEARKEIFADFYKKRHQHRKENIAISAIRYFLLAVGTSAIAYLIRNEITWLATVLGAGALIFGLIAAYGAGKCREM